MTFPKCDCPTFGIAVLTLAVTLTDCAFAQTPFQQQTKDIGIDQRLGETLPLELEFRDESGNAVKLGDYFGERPVLIMPVYYECPMLCGLELNGLVRTLRSLEFMPGQEFEIITPSFDPREGPDLARKKKQSFLEILDRPGAEKGWHFLTGDEKPIAELMESLGFRYKFDPETKQYIHAAGLMLVTPDGRLSRYFYGVDHRPADLRLGLVEASENRIGSAVDRVLLFCYQYDPATGKYGLAVMNTVRVLGGATLAMLAVAIAIMLRRERRVRGRTDAVAELVEG